MDGLRLTKYQALGNDFLILLLTDSEKAALDARHLDWPVLASRVCHRQADIGALGGADGLILGIDPAWSDPNWSESAVNEASCPDGTASVRMVLYNSDGSRAGMSGNGSACLAYAIASAQDPWSQRISDLQEAYLTVEIATDSGTRTVRWRSPYVETDDGAHVSIEPHIDVIMQPVEAGPSICSELHELITETFGDSPRGTGDVGNPHLVIATDRKVKAEEAKALGASYEQHFPAGINVEFVWPIGGDSGAKSGPPSSLGMAVWERGAGVTEACGTGAVVAATLAREWGLVKPDIWTSVLMHGGSATVAQTGPDGAPQLQIWAEHVGDLEWPLLGPWLGA